MLQRMLPCLSLSSCNSSAFPFPLLVSQSPGAAIPSGDGGDGPHGRALAALPQAGDSLHRRADHLQAAGDPST
eukprot:6192684-Pleurochrysis_carterae.AAC.1